MLDVRECVEPSHLGIRDAARELRQGGTQALVPRERRLPDHRRGLVGREIVAVVLHPPPAPRPNPCVRCGPRRGRGPPPRRGAPPWSPGPPRPGGARTPTPP